MKVARMLGVDVPPLGAWLSPRAITPRACGVAAATPSPATATAEGGLRPTAAGAVGDERQREARKGDGEQARHERASGFVVRPDGSLLPSLAPGADQRSSGAPRRRGRHPLQTAGATEPNRVGTAREAGIV